MLIVMYIYYLYYRGISVSVEYVLWDKRSNI